jgi:biopolymer transport protein ExbD
MRKSGSGRIGSDGGNIDMTPMLDIVFIMLIFFIVTTSFVREIGVPVHGLSDRPTTTNPVPLEAVAVRIENGNVIRIDGKAVSLGSVAANLERLLAEAPDRPIVVLASDHSDAGTLVGVIDAVRRTGVTSVPVARWVD